MKPARQPIISKSIRRRAAILASDQVGGEPTHLTFLLNFFDELRRRVPVGGK